MVTRKKDDQKVKEQKWENPLDPEKPGDDRDQEQLLRQYKEAKRLNENLTDKDTKKKTTKI
jgi:hypothetical protein